MEISAFLDRAVFTVLFAVCVSPTRKFSYVPFTRCVRSRHTLLFLRPLPTSLSPIAPFLSFQDSPLLSGVSLSLSIQTVHPRAPGRRARRSVRSPRHTRKYTRARAHYGCISMYFYARVIAPTVYFYPTRVICNGPPSSIERTERGRRKRRRRSGRRRGSVAIGARKKRSVDPSRYFVEVQPRRCNATFARPLVKRNSPHPSGG